HYSYEDESQESGSSRSATRDYAAQRFGESRPRLAGSGPLDNTAAFFGKGAGASAYKLGDKRYPARPKLDIPAPTGRTGLGKGVRVRHPKYGEGIIAAREGEGEDAKITVQFSGHGTKKLVEKFAQLERV
ncbi:MAG TPA: hypothetical protein VM865_03375, partial [Acidobacteriaceae bacterium]|nr:hypothetical protein [Acidobacteriaceae bacterium]